MTVEKNSSKKNVWVVIPASGVGSRMRSDIPKQYLTIYGRTVLEHTITRFVAVDDVAGLLIVVSQSDEKWRFLEQDLIDKYQSRGLQIESTIGGNERSETVLKGLSFLLNKKALSPKQWIMVHDAARPCVREGDIHKLLTIRSDNNADGGILATPVTDTLKQANTQNGAILGTHSREALWQAQTPQLFQLGSLLESLHKAKEQKVTITDEASAMEHSNKCVRLVEGSSDNIKLTTPADLAIISFLLSAVEENDGF